MVKFLLSLSLKFQLFCNISHYGLNSCSQGRMSDEALSRFCRVIIEEWRAAAIIMKQHPI